MKSGKQDIIFTIGHSIRSIEEFIDILRIHSVELVADVRTVPRSRHNPQFSRDLLTFELEKSSISYKHFSKLGGLRSTSADSPNTAWRNASFRGFADYMLTGEFHSALEDLIKATQEKRTAVMCAEALPWRCHRSLIADALLVRGISVLDIIGKGDPHPHRLTPWARVKEGRITYPAGPSTNVKQSF